MNTSENKNFDSLEHLIFEEGLKIIKVEAHKELDLILIFLNTSAIFKQKLSNYSRLKNASQGDLNKYELIAGGTGIHWKRLDEDLSLKGFLRDELKNMASGEKIREVV